MTDTGGRSAPQIPIFRTAFDAYRLGLGAIFTSARMFRFFLYGLVISAVVVGGIRYFRLSGIPYVLTRDSAWQAEFDFTIELLFSILTLGLVAVIQAPLGIAVIRQVLMQPAPASTYFSLIHGRRGRGFCMLTFLVYLLFLAASFAFVPVALAYGMNPIYRGHFMSRAMHAPDLLLAILFAWPLASCLSGLVSAGLTFRFCSLARESPPSEMNPRVPMLRVTLVYAVALVPMLVLAIAIYYAGVAAYLVQHWGVVGPALSSSKPES